MSIWYKRMRNISERSWFKDGQALQVYDYLEEKAYLNDSPYQGQIIRRGSCPYTRSEIAEVTGLSPKQIDRCLKLLLNSGEIIIKGNNRFSVATICKYGCFSNQENLFGTAEGIAEGITEGIAGGTAEGTALYNIEEEVNNNINPYLSLNIKRESINKTLDEIKNLYNKTFKGVLPEWQRKSDKMAVKVYTCISRFGRQSVDMVFDQIKHEPFSLGCGDTGFIADFKFIFNIDQYEGYLSRYKLRIQKKQQPQPEPQQMKKSVGVIEEQQEPQKQDRRAFLLSWVDAETTNPSNRGQELLKACWERGELQRLGIDWKPNKV